jgi:hypothetical protein
MKVVITESQYRKLQRHLREQERLEEIDLKRFGRKTLATAAIASSSLFGSPEAKGQSNYDYAKSDYDYVRSDSDSMTQSRNVEPTGRFTFPTDYGGRRDKVVVDNNILNITSPTQIADILQMVSTQYDSLVIPIEEEDINDTTNITDIIKNYMIDSSYGGKNKHGYYFVPKGVKSEDEIYVAKPLKKVWGVLKGVFGKNVRLPIKDVNISKEIVERFINLVKAEKTPFGIKINTNGMKVIYKEFDYN